jgi:eukaryotic-like serine/threonine-protein kinase
MGTVYRARDLLVDDEVALKLLDRADRPTESQIERIRQEVRLTRKVTHPNVVRTHDLNDANGLYYITMELIQGCDLRSILDANGPGAPSPLNAVEIAIGVCDGLTAAHAAGVVHRDLKPANILIDRVGRVVVTDFGVACGLSWSAITEQGYSLAGTPLYMAPEQVSGALADARTDIYAVGLLLFEMCTGTRPFAGDTTIAVAVSRLQTPPPDPRQRASVPDALAELILSCLARSPRDRPESAAHVAGALRRWRVSAALEGVANIVELVSQITSTQISNDATIVAPDPALSMAARERSFTATTTRTLAVVPLAFHGPEKDAYLATALASELIDVLSRTRGLRVLSSTACEQLRSEHDNAVLGRKLGADVLVEGTVQTSGDRVRVFARLIEVSTGLQLWAERFSGTLGDVFEFQDTMSQRIAEALRVSLGTTLYRGEASHEAIELYLQARCRDWSFQRFGSAGALELLERCLDVSPRFAPAVAQHAIACMRTWFLPGQTQERDLAALALVSIERAEELAPDFPETHIARAMFSVQHDAFREAAVALTRALRLAPTCALALQFLGQMLCEAGRVEQGLSRLKLAYQLDPTLAVCLIDTARCNALRGDMDGYARVMEALEAHPSYRVATAQLAMRVATWRGELDRVREIAAENADPTDEISINVRYYARIVLREVEPIAATRKHHGALEPGRSPRFASMLCQLSAEALCVAGHPNAALHWLQRAASTVLLDLEWLERCPALSLIRPLPAFAECKRLVQKRVEAIWEVDMQK